MVAAHRVQAFKGCAPRVSPRLLGPSQAQVAQDCYLYNGEVRAYRDKLAVAVPFSGLLCKTIYRYVDTGKAYWFDWPTAVNVARVPVTGDIKNRIFYTGDGVPKKTGNDIGIPVVTQGPQAFYYMGVKNPTTAPGISDAGGGSGNAESTAWAITYVTGWGEESGPSPAIVSTTYKSGDAVTITRAADSPDPLYNIVKWRVYRLITGSNGVASWFFVGEQGTFATTTFLDNLPDVTVVTQGGFPSANQANFAEPPTDLTGLVGMPNGMLAGFSPSLKQVCFSEPYFPYAWPANYRRGLQYDPQAAGAASNMLVVAPSSGKPAWFVGNDPSSLSGDTLAALQACVSARGLAESPFGVIWPSPDGLYMVQLGGVGSIVTRQIFDKKTWQAIKPGSMAAAIYDGRYYATVLDGSQVMIFDPNEPDDAVTFLNVQAQAIFSDPNADGLYFVIAGVIYQWEGDGLSLRSSDWRSKVFTDERPNSKGYVRLLFTIPGISGQSVPTFEAYAAVRAAIAAQNAALEYAGYGGGAFGFSAFGESAFGADGFTDLPPDIGSNVQVMVYGDGSLVDTALVTNQLATRIAGGVQAKKWEYEVIGKVNVQELAAAESMEQIQELD